MQVFELTGRGRVPLPDVGDDGEGPKDCEVKLAVDDDVLSRADRGSLDILVDGQHQHEEHDLSKMQIFLAI